MKLSDYIAIIAIIIPTVVTIIGGLFAIISNTKKFELSESYKNEIMVWYKDTIHIMRKIIGLCEGKRDRNETDLLLMELSAQIEIGRFYFPNINKKDSFGKDKPLAYQGYRHIILDFLVYFYDTAKRDETSKQVNALYEFLRLFTSIVFEIVDPRERICKIGKYSDFVMKNNMTLNDFLQDETNFKKFYTF